MQLSEESGMDTDVLDVVITKSVGSVNVIKGLFSGEQQSAISSGQGSKEAKVLRSLEAVNHKIRNGLDRCKEDECSQPKKLSTSS